MNKLATLTATALFAAIFLVLTGCGGESNEMTQEEVRYLSHMDQARFFQRQGELKASTLEARSAIELQPESLDPYFLIVDNLLKAGDALNAERQLNWVLENVPETQIGPEALNRAWLIAAEAKLMQGKHQESLETLSKITPSDRHTDTQAALLKADTLFASGQLDQAYSSYERARDIDPGAIGPVIGLSRTAFAQGNKAQSRQLITKAEELDPESTELWLWKAQVAHAEQNWSSAEDFYIRALEDIGQYDVMTERKYATISALIRVLRAQGKQSEAFVYEEILAKSAPGTIKSNMMAAQEAFEQGDLTSAARYLEEIRRQAPTHEPSALMLGLIRFRQGRVEEAEKLLAPVAETSDSETATKLLAATRLQMRNPQGAKEILDTLDNTDSDPETLALVAIASLASGDSSTGEALMERALASNPDNHQLALRYANYLRQQGKYTQATDLTKQVLEKAPELHLARGLLIKTHTDSGNLPAAVNVASAWLKQYPDNIEALVYRGNLALQEGNPDIARDFFTQAVKKDPEAPAPLIALGRLAINQSATDEARKWFRDAVKVAPNNRQAIQGVAALLKPEEIEQFMREVLDKEPSATGPRLVLLELALRQNRTQQADELTASLLEREEETRASRAAPLVANIYNLTAARLREEGEAERSTEVLNRALALFPENEAISLQAAKQAFLAGSADKARSILQDVKKQHPDSANPYWTEALYFESLKEYREAAEFYQLAMDKRPSPGLVSDYAEVLEKDNKETEAIAVLESGVSSFPEHPPLRLRLAMLQQAQGSMESARHHYESLLTSMPENTIALNNLAWIYLEASDPRALDVARRAYKLAPENGAIADTLGYVLFKSGKQAESLPLLEEAHRLRADSEEIALHLAEAYRAAGMNAEAKKVLEKFGGQH